MLEENCAGNKARKSQKDKGDFHHFFHPCSYLRVVMCPKLVYIALQQHLQAKEKHSANVANVLDMQIPKLKSPGLSIPSPEVVF